MPDWEYNPEVEEEAIKESPVVYKYDKFDPNAAVEQAAADASRQTGDVAIYLYYIQSVGWIPTLIFVGAITAFTFCISFPSTSFLIVRDPCSER